MNRLLHFFLRRRASARYLRRQHERLALIEQTLDSIYPISADVIAERQRLLRAIDAREGWGTRFGGAA